MRVCSALQVRAGARLRVRVRSRLPLPLLLLLPTWLLAAGCWIPGWLIGRPAAAALSLHARCDTVCSKSKQWTHPTCCASLSLSLYGIDPLSWPAARASRTPSPRALFTRTRATDAATRLSSLTERERERLSQPFRLSALRGNAEAP